MYCPKCYRMLPDDSTRCPNCGANLENPTCIKCGKVISPGDKFCQRCGAAVSGYKAPPKRAVDWVWGDNTSESEAEPPTSDQEPSPGSWKDFCNDMSDLTHQFKDNWKGYAETAKESYKQYQQNNTYEENAQSAEYESVPNACPSCGRTNINYQTVSESKGIGCFLWLVLLIIALCVNIIIFIAILLILLLARKSTKTVTYAVCQDCGKRWKKGIF